MRAEQLMNGVTNMVMRRSFQLLMVRVLMMAGIAQAPPDISATILRPLRPNQRISRSKIKAARAM